MYVYIIKNKNKIMNYNNIIDLYDLFKKKNVLCIIFIFIT